MPTDFLTQQFNIAELKNFFSGCVSTYLQEKYPQGAISQWSYHDKNGVVYGWPEEIKLQTIKIDTTMYICIPLVECKRGHLAFVKRLLAFYKTCVRDRSAKAMIVSMLMSDSDEALSKEMGNETVVFSRTSGVTDLAPKNISGEPIAVASSSVVSSPSGPLSSPPYQAPPAASTVTPSSVTVVTSSPSGNVVTNQPEEALSPGQFTTWKEVFIQAQIEEDFSNSLAALFEENEIELDQLEEMTRDHLRELGVKVGYQLKIMKLRDRLYGTRTTRSPTGSRIARESSSGSSILASPSGSLSGSRGPSFTSPQDLSNSNESVGSQPQTPAPKLPMMGSAKANFLRSSTPTGLKPAAQPKSM